LRAITPENIAALSPSSPIAWSSSAIASPGLKHGDGGDGLEPIAILAVALGVVPVVGPSERRSQLVVGERRDRQSVGREEQRMVEPELVHPLVHDARRHCRRPVQGVARRNAPPGESRHAEPALRLERHLTRQSAAVLHRVEAGRDRLARDLDEEVAHERRELDQVAIAVDHRMVELSADLLDGVAANVVQGRSSSGLGDAGIRARAPSAALAPPACRRAPR
jgi:hypothetical protein